MLRIIFSRGLWQQNFKIPEIRPFLPSILKKNDPGEKINFSYLVCFNINKTYLECNTKTWVIFIIFMRPKSHHICNFEWKIRKRQIFLIHLSVGCSFDHFHTWSDFEEIFLLYFSRKHIGPFIKSPKCQKYLNPDVWP